MADTPESKVKKEVRKIARELGFTVVDNVVSPMGGSRGRADMTMNIGVFGLEVEVKASPSAKVTPLQLLEHRRRAALGQIHVIVHSDNLSEFASLLKELKGLSECSPMIELLLNLRPHLYTKLVRPE